MKFIRNRRLLIAVIVIIVAVLVGLVWLVWPEPPPKDLTLRLKFVRSEIVNGQTNILFRFEGAEKYEIQLNSYRYLCGTNTTPTNGVFVFNNPGLNRHFAVSKPDFIDQEWQLQAYVDVTAREKNQVRHSLTFLKDILRFQRVSKSRKPPFRSLVKALWEIDSWHVISEQIITSDVITNTPPH